MFIKFKESCGVSEIYETGFVVIGNQALYSWGVFPNQWCDHHKEIIFVECSPEVARLSTLGLLSKNCGCNYEWRLKACYVKIMNLQTEDIAYTNFQNRIIRDVSNNLLFEINLLFTSKIVDGCYRSNITLYWVSRDRVSMSFCSESLCKVSFDTYICF